MLPVVLVLLVLGVGSVGVWYVMQGGLEDDGGAVTSPTPTEAETPPDQPASRADSAADSTADGDGIAEEELLSDTDRVRQLLERNDGQLDPDIRGEFAAAERELRAVIDSGEDVALANDARFQLGEIHFQQAVALADERAETMFERAIEDYRAVKPKEEMLAAQQTVIDNLMERRRRALQSGNSDALPGIQRVLERAQSKLAALRSRPDQTLDAALKVGQAYFQRGDYDAARVLMRHIGKFAETAEQRRTADYFVLMSYIMQNQVEKAVAGYERFQSSHRGAPIASNLPLAMGTMFLSQGDPATAVEYFDQQMTIYPEAGEFLDMAVIQKASAESRLGRFDQALQTFRGYLQQNPDGAADVRAQAQFGIAGAYRDTSQWDQAVAAYRKLQREFPEQRELADSASMWIGYCLAQKGEAAAALPLLEDYYAANPESQLAPTALFTIARCKLLEGAEDAAVDDFREVAAKFPDTDPATFAYFQIAGIHMAAQRFDEMEAALDEFMRKYPDDPKVFAAVDTIAQNHLANGRLREAVAQYQQFAADYPQSEQTAQALLNASNLWRDYARSLGRYTALNADQRAEWESAIDASLEAAERLAGGHPQSEQLALGMRSLLDSQKMLLEARLREPGQVTLYFENLAEEFAGNPAARAKALFTLASFLNDSDPQRAFEIMSQAYDSGVTFAPGYLDLYGAALIERGDFNAASEVYQKIAADYPVPDGSDPQAAPRDVQSAQAVALFGLGRIAQAEGRDAEAAKLFDQLVRLYPWSPKNLEASLALARADLEAGRLDQALERVVPIIRARTATAELRANAMLLGGDIQKAYHEQADDPDEKRRFLEAAIDYYIKIARFYSGVPKPSAEGLWRGAQLLERQAATLDDPERKTRQIDMARKAYANLADNYPASPHAAQAAARVSALQQQ